MSSRFIINLFGTGIRYWICDIPMPQFEKMETIKEQHKVEWEHLLFDFDFLKRFGYEHWSEISRYPEQVGFLLNKENRIEIKLKAKLITRFFAYELSNQETLFPLYQTYEKEYQFQGLSSTKRLLIMQFEKGLIGKYEILTNQFDISTLKFGLTQLPSQVVISGIMYQGSELKCLKDDTLVTGTKVILLN